MGKLRELVIGMICVPKKHHMFFPQEEQSLSYFLTMVLSPKRNPELQKISLCLGWEHRGGYCGGWDCSSWWEDPRLASLVKRFEERLAGFVHAFQHKGIFLNYCDDWFSPNNPVNGLQLMRDVVPLMFPELTQQGLLIDFV